MTREPSPKPDYDPALEALFPRYDDSKERKWIADAHKGDAEPKHERKKARK